MTKLSFIAALGLTVLAASTAAAQAQAPASSKTPASSKSTVAASPTTMPRADERPISVDYYNVPLRDAITRLAVFGGRTVVMKADIGNPVVNASYADVHWRRSLDILELAQMRAPGVSLI